MNNWKLNYAIDLNRTGRVVPVLIPGTFVVGDDCAHEWNVAVYDDGEPANLSGYSVVAYINRFDGRSVVVTGSVQGNVATVTLSEECYAVSGLCTGILRIAKAGGEKVTISVIRFAVGIPISDEVVSPGDLLPSLDELLAQIEAMEAATAAASELAQRIYSTADNGVRMDVSWALGTVLSATGAESSSITTRIRTPMLEAGDIVLLPDTGIKLALYCYDANRAYIADATVKLAEQMLDVRALAPGSAAYFRVVAATTDDQDLTDRVDEIAEHVKVLRSNVSYVDTLIYQGRNSTVSLPCVPCKYTGNVDNLTELTSLPNEMWVVLDGSTLQGLLGDAFGWALSGGSTYTLSRRDLFSSVTTFDIRRINGVDAYYGYNTAADPTFKWVNLTLSAIVSDATDEVDKTLSAKISVLESSLSASVNNLYAQDLALQNETNRRIYSLSDRSVRMDAPWALGTVLSATGAESLSNTTRIHTSMLEAEDIVLLPDEGIKIALYYYDSVGAYIADATVKLAEQMLDVRALAPDGAAYFRVVAATTDDQELTDRVDEIAGRVKVLLSSRVAMDALEGDLDALAADVEAQRADLKNLATAAARHSEMEHSALFGGEPATIRWEKGGILALAGGTNSAANRIRSAEYLPVGDVAFFADEGVKIAFFYYDADKAYLTDTAVKLGEVSWLAVGDSAPDGAAYFRVVIAASDDADLSGLLGTFPGGVRIFVSGDVGDAFTRTHALAVQKTHLLYTEFEWIPGWWNPTGGYYDTEHMHSQSIPVEAGRAYYLGYKIADQGCTGAFFDCMGNWLAPLLPDDISAYAYKCPDGTGIHTNYADLYTFTAPQGACFFSCNLSSGAARRYRQFVATMPVLALENTGNYRFDDDWPGYQAHKDRRLCVIGASGVMIDRLYREVPLGSGTWQYIVGFQEYLVPWYASVESYGFSSGSWARNDASENLSIYNGIVTNGVDLSSYDEFLLIPSTSGVTADTIGEIDSADVDTYMGGLNAVLDKIHAESPYAKVYLANALRKGSYYTSETQRAKIDKINEQLAAIAAAKSLQLIDLAGGCGINAYNQDLMTYDGTHLNQEGGMRQGLFLRREMIGF